MKTSQRFSPVTAVVLYVWMSIVAAAVFFPVAYAVLGAFHSTQDLNSGLGSLIGGRWTFENFVNAWNESEIFSQLKNSFVVTILQTLAQFITAAIAAYAVVFGNIKRRVIIMAYFIFPIMIPGELNNLVNFLTVSRLGFYDTVIGIFLPYMVSAMALFLFYQAFKEFPQEIREAAVLDGIGPLRFFWGFVLPLNKPVCMTVLITSAIGAWNGYMWPLLITMSDSVRTIQPGVRSLAEEAGTDTGMVLAGLLIASIPMLILVTISQKFLSHGLTAGAVK